MPLYIAHASQQPFAYLKSWKVKWSIPATANSAIITGLDCASGRAGNEDLVNFHTIRKEIQCFWLINFWPAQFQTVRSVHGPGKWHRWGPKITPNSSGLLVCSIAIATLQWLPTLPGPVIPSLYQRGSAAHAYSQCSSFSIPPWFTKITFHRTLTIFL